MYTLGTTACYFYICETGWRAHATGWADKWALTSVSQSSPYLATPKIWWCFTECTPVQLHCIHSSI